MKNVRSRKTDVKDAIWLTDLMAHGLIRPSFVPDEPTQQVRDLLSTRKQMVKFRQNGRFPINLDELKDDWEGFAERDALWAILSDDSKVGGK